MFEHRWLIPSFFFLALSVVGTSSSTSLNDEELSAKQFLSNYEKSVVGLKNEMTIASWNYETNITDYNAEVSLKISKTFSAFEEEAFQNSTHFNLTLISDPEILRQLKLVGVRPLEPEDEEELTTIIAEMGKIY